MKTFIASIIVLVLIIGGYVLLHRTTPAGVSPTPTAGDTSSTGSTMTDTSFENRVTYFCTQGTFDALFTDGQVELTLGTRKVTLPQVRSGSGIRYEANGLTLVGKGSNALLTENGMTTYDNCLAGNVSASGAGTGLRAFEDAGHTFTFIYPTAFMLSGGEMGYTQSWRINATTSGLVLAVVTVPRTYEPGTNFADAKFTVGVSSDPSAITLCAVAANGDIAQGQTTLNGITFNKFTFGGAGAGNFYDTTSYRTIYDGDCYVVEYTIHSTNIANYPPERGIKEFNKAKVQDALLGIVKSFTFIVSPE
jgi:membrane-bound inhibitor of C-type lysozyme